MALQKTKTVKGFDGTYWRLIQYSVNLDRNDCVCTFGLYKDKATRDADTTALIDQVTLNIPNVLEEIGSKDTIRNLKISTAYKCLKEIAIEEEAKEEGKDTTLAYFHDAIKV